MNAVKECGCPDGWDSSFIVIGVRVVNIYSFLLNSVLFLVKPNHIKIPFSMHNIVFSCFRFQLRSFRFDVPHNADKYLRDKNNPKRNNENKLKQIWAFSIFNRISIGFRIIIKTNIKFNSSLLWNFITLLWNQYKFKVFIRLNISCLNWFYDFSENLIHQLDLNGF